MTVAQEKPMKHYRWRTIYGGSGDAYLMLHDVGIEPDDSLYNPRNYPEELARAAVLRADARKAEQLAAARKRGVEKRPERQAARIHEAARRIVDEKGIGQRTHCYCCRKYLTDPMSIERGIGSECWQRVLERISQFKGEAKTAK